LKDTLANSFKIGTFWNIPLKVHWTFGLLMLFVGYTAFTTNLSMWQAVGFMSTIVLLFLCVVMHEYGHALMAKKLGVNTKDIILSPIGGVARLTTMPEHPMKELKIAFAGPLVNLVIGGVTALVLYFYDGSYWPTLRDFKFNEPIELARYVVWINSMLFFFNLIPAFPMDGGRILRAFLATKMSHFKATNIATFIGRVLAVGFVIYGIFSQELVLAMIGLVIFMMAGQESAQSKTNHIFRTTPAYKVMRAQYTRIHENATYQSVINIYQQGKEKNYIVCDSLDNIIGAIPELFIKDVIKNEQPTKLVSELYSEKLEKIPHDMPLKDIFDIMKEKGLSICLVEDHEQIVGVIDRNDITSFIDK
jgi:Zn-dependent protease/predicted transcriptional regulator